jgi:hypothetical protein
MFPTCTSEVVLRIITSRYLLPIYLGCQKLRYNYILCRVLGDFHIMKAQCGDGRAVPARRARTA